MILGTQNDALIKNLHLLMRSPFMIDAQMRKLANTNQCLVPTSLSVQSHLPLLKRGDRGAAVKQLQGMLNRLGAKPPLPQTGNFLDMTWAAVTRFQSSQGLKPVDGIVGPKTWAALERMLGEGIRVKPHEAPKDLASLDFPPKPSFGMLTHSARVALFGSFRFVNAPTEGDREVIRLTDGWYKDNIVTVSVPQFAKIQEGKYSRARVHRLIKDQFLGLWQAWEDEGVLGHVLTWEGAYVARYKRKVKIPPEGDASKLSNHSWGTAFDINYAWNKLGSTPAAVGETGCVRELVETANRYGFYWGGHWGGGSADGMHFEVAKIV